ncbi:hypothetical protein EB796_018912 [Bugula neritina]|uniref:Aminopeptidase N-like N-terminal domain-containing protein n=1 Tax=Bugula neritina TaxID=10212 RepID=A0A7J7J966_BUGNE|nr:hypothetical protein EB796_018912 [Bugula neritina]
MKTTIIENESVQFSGGGKELEAKVELDAEAETATFTFPEALPQGQAILSVQFTGCLNDKMKGFYRSKYTSPDVIDWLTAKVFPSSCCIIIITTIRLSETSLTCWECKRGSFLFNISIIELDYLLKLSYFYCNIPLNWGLPFLV